MNDLYETEPIILALDSSSKVTSLAVARGRSLLGAINDMPDQKRSEMLWTEVGTLLAKHNTTLGDIDLFAVCIGPGGFTGLRVGMSAVMGFAASTDKPIVGVSSLEATAFTARPAEMACALVNAYKGEVYSQLFSFDAEGVPIAKSDAMVSSLAKALERADDKELVFVGDGTEAGADEIRSFAASRSYITWTVKTESGLAEAIAQLAYWKYLRGETQTAAGIKAFYVRPSEAEIKLSLGLLGSKIKRSLKP